MYKNVRKSIDMRPNIQLRKRSLRFSTNITENVFGSDKSSPELINYEALSKLEARRFKRRFSHMCQWL